MSQTVEVGIGNIFERSRNKLLELIESKPPVSIQAQAILSLVRTRAPEAKKIVSEFFIANPNEKDAIRAMSELGGNDAVEALARRVREKKALHRNLIAELLGNLNHPESITCLKELLADPDRHVRFQAANSLYNIGGQNGALALCKFISDPDEWISMTILKLLCKLKEYESIPYLVQHFTKETDTRRKALMVSFLSMFKSVTLVNVFDEGIRSRDARLKANSIEAVGELDLPEREIESRISHFLSDPNNRIRANAILIMARNNPEQAKPHIELMVESGDNMIRRSAAYILGQIPPAGTEELAKKLIVDQVDEVRKRMILSLKKYPFDFVLPLLDPPMKDQNKWVRRAAVEIAKHFPEFPKGPILKLLKSETVYPNLVSCMEFFSSHPDEEAAKVIKTRVQDARFQVVNAAVKSLLANQGLAGIEPLVAQVFNARDIRIIRDFILTAFTSGSLDTFEAILDRSTQVKRPWMNDRFLPALDGCLELLANPSALPRELADALTGLPAVVQGAMKTQTATPSEPSKEESPPEAPAGEEAIIEEKEKLSKDFVSGVKYFNLGKYKKARQLLLAALEENPDQPKAYLYLGLIASEEKENEEARDCLEKFLESEPDNLKATMLLGKVYKSLRDWTNTARIFENVTKWNPPPAPKIMMRILRELGLACIFLKQSEQAIDVLAKVCNQDPSDSEAVFYLATAHFNTNNFPQAKGVLNELFSRINEEDKLWNMARNLEEKIDEALASGGGPEPDAGETEAPAEEISPPTEETANPPEESPEPAPQADPAEPPADNPGDSEKPE